MPKKTAPESKPSTTFANVKFPKMDKARDAKLSIQNNPDSLPWIKNKVIKEALVGKKKSG
jgi:hypothetical protein